jgi:hypothetical protein
MTPEEKDKIITDDLKAIILSAIAEPWPMYHDLNKTKDFVSSAYKVLSYYSRLSEMATFIAELTDEQHNFLADATAHYITAYEPKDDYTISNVVLEDTPDGGANVSFDAGPKMTRFLAGQGMLRILEKQLKMEDV